MSWPGAISTVAIAAGGLGIAGPRAGVAVAVGAILAWRAATLPREQRTT